MNAAAGAAGWEAAHPGFVAVHTEVETGRPAAAVFDFATTPAQWHRWHPATVAVRDVPDRPLTTGETILEEIAVAGRREAALWTVMACESAARWEIATATPSGDAWIVYCLTPTGAGCRFQRTLRFRSKRWPWRTLDDTLLRWVLVRQSARALANLRAVLEG